MMTVQSSSLYTQARDDLYELQERLVERRREYFKQIGTASNPGLSHSAFWYGYESSSWRELFALKQDNVDFSAVAALKPIKDHYAAWQRDRSVSSSLPRLYLDYRSEWANSLGAHPDELVLTCSTTDAMTYGFCGINWQKHDLCVTTNMEHSGGLSGLYAMANRFGIQLPNWGTPVYLDARRGSETTDGAFALRHDGNVLSLPTGIASHSDDLCGYPIPVETVDYDERLFSCCLQPELERIAEQNPSTLKALFFSSPSYITGARLPETHLARWAWQRGLYTMMDGAHLPGMIDVNLHTMGIDFCAMSGRKWQCSHVQTGISYLRRGHRRADMSRETAVFECASEQCSDYINPTPMIEFWTDMEGRLGEIMPNQPARVSSISYRDPMYADIRSVSECVRLWDELGRSLVESYIVTLSQYLRWRLSEVYPISALLSEFRQRQGESWTDVWRPKDSIDTLPSHCRSGLTAWTPFSYDCTSTDQPLADACMPLTAQQSSAQQYRAKQLLSQLSSRFGINARTTRCPHQIRVGDGRYSANAIPDVGPVTVSSPLRFSTYIYHQPEDIDKLVEALIHPDIMPLYDMRESL